LAHQKLGSGILTGTVVWFHESRGYGFIRSDAGGKDLFFHMDEVRKAGMVAPVQGQRLSFDIGEHQQRRAAVNLRSIE
jgi:CspA family cold shock protein